MLKEHIEIGDAAETILRVAQEERCDLILLGEAHPGVIRRWLAKATGVTLGSIGCQVVQLADMPVLVVQVSRTQERSFPQEGSWR